MKEAIQRYRMYEYIRDNPFITPEMSNTKMLLVKLMQDNKVVKEYCNKKMLEEKREVEEAIKGVHFHENMTKREILVNEISQYLYWQTIIAIAKNVSFEEFNEIERIDHILKYIDLEVLSEKEQITAREIIVHDLEQMAKRNYLKEVV